jgi:WD40 repeat protein
MLTYQKFTVIFSVKVNTPVHSISLHPNQVELLISDSTGAIYLWDLRSDRDDSLITDVDISEYVGYILFKNIVAN